MEEPKKEDAGIYKCGTLTYTKRGLIVLFGWLIWGDICYTLMEAVYGPIMQMKFKSLHAMNWEIGLLLATIPTAVYFTLNPIISFKSDRFRSRWGRRIPFLLFSLPMLVASLVALAYADRFGFWLHERLSIEFASPERFTLYTLGLSLIVFVFFNTFLTSTFWYLFNDVVPEHLLARFMSLFRIVGLVSGGLYNEYVFPYSGTHATEIFLGAAALYAFGFGLMCLRVKEGQYEPPAPYVDGAKGPLGFLKTYGKECHSHKLYWYLWLSIFVASIGNGIAVFDLFLKQGIGLDMFQIGHIASLVLYTTGALVIISGWLADRYHPARVVLAAQILTVFLVLPSAMFWLFWHPNPADKWFFEFPFLEGVPFLGGLANFEIQKVYLLSMMLYIGVAAPVAALSAMWDPVMLMRTFPRSRYGQFCATHAVWRAVGGMLGGFLAGLFLDYMGKFGGFDSRYFFNPVWILCFAIPGFILFIMFFREWKRHGGDNYVAPLPPLDHPQHYKEVTAAPVSAAASTEELTPDPCPVKK